MTYDANAASRYAERNTSNQAAVAIKMLIGDWYIDELGILTRKITARYLAVLSRPSGWYKKQSVQADT
jgi:hypothetical protein